MRKVLHVITGLNTGGAEKMLSKLLKSIPQSEIQSRVVCLKDQGVVANEIQALNITVDSLGMKGLFSSFRALFKLRSLVKTWKPDLVHAWMYHANMVSAFAVSKKGPPLIWGIRYSIADTSNLKINSRCLIWLGQFFSRIPRIILYNSFVAAEQHEKLGYFSGTRRVIPNAIDLGDWSDQKANPQFLKTTLSLSDTTPIVGMVARYDPQKDFPTFIEAAKILASRMPAVHFVLVGPGVNEDQVDLMTQIGDSILKGRIHLMGEQRDVRSYVGAFDLFTLSSKNGEAFPNVLLEAMALGVPVVATDVGDCARILQDVGVVVPARDPVALAQAWEERLKKSPDERKKIGQVSREKVKRNYSIEKVREEFMALYRDVLA